MRKSNFREQLRRVRRRVEPQARLRAGERASGVEAKAKSKNHAIFLRIPVLRENLAS